MFSMTKCISLKTPIFMIPAILLVTSCTRQEPPSYNTDIPIDEVMEHVIEPSAEAFWRGFGFRLTATGEEDLSPKTDADWKKVEDGAATVVLGMNALMVDGYAREPVVEWDSYARTVAAIASRGKSSAEKKNAAELESIGGELEEACDGCHRKFDLRFVSPPGPASPYK